MNRRHSRRENNMEIVGFKKILRNCCFWKSTLFSKIIVEYLSANVWSQTVTVHVSHPPAKAAQVHLLIVSHGRCSKNVHIQHILYIHRHGLYDCIHIFITREMFFISPPRTSICILYASAHSGRVSVSQVVVVDNEMWAIQIQDLKPFIWFVMTHTAQSYGIQGAPLSSVKMTL